MSPESRLVDSRPLGPRHMDLCCTRKSGTMTIQSWNANENPLKRLPRVLHPANI